MIVVPQNPRDGDVVEAWTVDRERDVVAVRWVYSSADGLWLTYRDGELYGSENHASLARKFTIWPDRYHASERSAVVALIDLLEKMIQDTKRLRDDMGSRAVRYRRRLRDLPETTS